MKRRPEADPRRGFNSEAKKRTARKDFVRNFGKPDRGPPISKSMMRGRYAGILQIQLFHIGCVDFLSYTSLERAWQTLLKFSR